MPRRKAAIKREVLPDPLFGSEEIAKFINVVMKAGKKSIAERIVYDALTMLTDRLHKEGASGDDDDSGKGGKGKGGKGVKSATKKTTASSAKTKSAAESSKEEIAGNLHTVLLNVAPTVEVKSRRVGGATYQVPIEVAQDRGVALAMRWILTAARKRGEKTMSQRLAAELHDAFKNRGGAIKTRDDVHRMAKANQAFAHYRW